MISGVGPAAESQMEMKVRVVAALRGLICGGSLSSALSLQQR